MIRWLGKKRINIAWYKKQQYIREMTKNREKIKMKVLYVGVKQKPEVREIDGSLSSMQELVGGYIEAFKFAPDVFCICNEEGILKQMPFNGVVNTTPVYGPYFFCGINEMNDFDTLQDEQIDALRNAYSSVKIVFVPIKRKQE